MEKYIKPEINIIVISQNDVITLSGVTTKTLGTDVEFTKVTAAGWGLNS